MKSHVVAGVDISEADIDRVEKAIRGGQLRAEVFPRLASLDTQISGTGATVSVRFTKKAGEGMPAPTARIAHGRNEPGSRWSTSAAPANRHVPQANHNQFSRLNMFLTQRRRFLFSPGDPAARSTSAKQR
jgi:hypothetical protein